MTLPKHSNYQHELHRGRMTDATMQPDAPQSASSRTDTRNARWKKHRQSYLSHSGCGCLSVAGIVIQLRSAVEPLSLSCGSVWKVNKSRKNGVYPLAVRWTLAAVIARCSSAQVLKRFTGLRTHPSRRRKRSLEAAGDAAAAAAAAFAPSRRGMREAVGVGVGAADDPRRNTQKYSHRSRNRRLTSKRWLMNHYAH